MYIRVGAVRAVCQWIYCCSSAIASSVWTKWTPVLTPFHAPHHIPVSIQQSNCNVCLRPHSTCHVAARNEKLKGKAANAVVLVLRVVMGKGQACSQIFTRLQPAPRTWQSSSDLWHLSIQGAACSQLSLLQRTPHLLVMVKGGLPLPSSSWGSLVCGSMCTSSCVSTGLHWILLGSGTLCWVTFGAFALAALRPVIRA